MNPNKPTSKLIPEQEELAEYFAKCKPCYAFGYRGLDIKLFQHDHYHQQLLVQAKGLGTTLDIIYIFDTIGGAKQLVAADLMLEIFADFADYIIFESTMGYVTKH